MSGTETYPDDAIRLAGFEGDSFNYSVLVMDSGTPVDLHSATFNFILGSLTEESSGVTITGYATGIITVSITNTAMAAITEGDHDIALQYTIGSSTTTLFSGTFTAKGTPL